MSTHRERSAPTVTAFRVTRENGLLVAAWTGGTWHSLYGRGDGGEDISHVLMPVSGSSAARADLGEWVLKHQDGRLTVMSYERFQAQYVELGR